MRLSLRLSAFFSGLALFACGSNSSNPPRTSSATSSTGTGMNVTIDQACTDLATARCTKRNSCSGGAGITRIYGDMATCQAREALSCKAALNAPNTGDSPDQAEKCSQALASASCADFLENNSPQACIIMGPGQIGAACAFAAECASTYCNKDKNAACGQCGAATAAGSECNDTFCARGQECTPSFQCQPYVAQDGMCDKTERFCGPELYCSATANTCQAAVAMASAPCGGAKGGCDSFMGLRCQGAMGSETCQSYNFVGDGQPCGPQQDGSFAACKAGACFTAMGPAGGAPGTCKANADDGQACNEQTGPNCKAGARCIGGKCTVPSGKCM